MKLFQIMMFLLIFNIAITVVGALHIYNLEINGEIISSSSDVNNTSSVSLTELGSPSTDIYVLIGQWAVAPLIAMGIGALAGNLFGAASSIARSLTAEGAAYGLFGGIIFVVFLNSYKILWRIVEIVPEPYRLGVSWIVGMFLGISGILIAVGYIQLVRGSMSTYL